MAEMTEEEADRLDELYTRTTPRVDPKKQGVFADHSQRLLVVDRLTAECLVARARAIGQTPTQVLASLVKEKIAGGGWYPEQ